MSLITLKNVTKTYGKDEAKTIALQNINLTINKGEMIAITGPSGSGKSTLLNIIGCLDSPTKGEYYLNQNNISSCKAKYLSKVRNKTFGFVVQYFALLNDFSVYENIQIPLEYSKIPKRKRKELILNMLDKLNIREKVKATPKELSGGQSQRVAIARALINNPDIILADEPTGALDIKTGKEVLQILKNLNDEGKTIVIITHDENIAYQCNRIIKIQDGNIVSDKAIDKLA